MILAQVSDWSWIPTWTPTAVAFVGVIGAWFIIKGKVDQHEKRLNDGDEKLAFHDASIGELRILKATNDLELKSIDGLRADVGDLKKDIADLSTKVAVLVDRDMRKHGDS